MSPQLEPGSVKTTCPYCGVGCGIIADVDREGVVSVRGDKDHPSNFGRLCSKGSALPETLDLDGRLLEPEVDGAKVDWDIALDLVADTFKKTIEKHGPDSVAFYVSGQCLTEDYYVANKLMKGFIGSANIDTNSRLCMASTVAGHIRAFGSDTVPGVYEDLELADLIILTGSNLAWCHPVLYQRIVTAKDLRPEMRIVVIDPRRTVTCDIADLHLPIRPDTDVSLFLGLLNFLNEAGTIDASYIDAHTQGFEAALKSAAAIDLAMISKTTNLAVSDLEMFYRWVANTEKTVTVYSQGVNQSTTGTDKVNAIINTHLATGRIGKPGMGPFSVTGQPNAMGGREVGGLANQLAAHMQIENPDHRNLVQKFWKSSTVPTKPGLKAVDLFNAMDQEKVKAIWIMATNPVDSMPDASVVEAALEKCPFVVVSDIVKNTDTTRHADVLLPALGWGEKSGTVTNSERRISRQRKFLAVPGNARPDWWALTEVARRMGWKKEFNYPNAASIFREHAALSAHENYGTRDFNIGAYHDLSEDAYNRFQPSQWPAVINQEAERNRRLFADGSFYTEDGRANFVNVEYQDTESNGPFILNTGRVRDHWHTMTRTGKSSRLSAHLAEPYIEISPEDASRLSVHDAELVRIESHDGEMISRILISDRQQVGTVFVPMHWTDQFAAKGRVNKLVAANVDPASGQPALKSAGVRIASFPAKWYGFAISTTRPEIPDVDYWATSRTRNGWQMEFASLSGAEDWTVFTETYFGKFQTGETWSTYVDEAQGVYRFAVIENGRLLNALFLERSPVVLSRSWVCAQLGEKISDNEILSGRASATRPDPGPVVCACFGVGINQINTAINEGGCSNVSEIGTSVQAGTNCGSCIPEIKVLLNARRSQQAAE